MQSHFRASEANESVFSIVSADEIIIWRFHLLGAGIDATEIFARTIHLSMDHYTSYDINKWYMK